MQLLKGLPEERHATTLEQGNNTLATKIRDLQNNEERMRDYITTLNKDKKVAEEETAQFRDDVAFLT